MWIDWSPKIPLAPSKSKNLNDFCPASQKIHLKHVEGQYGTTETMADARDIWPCWVTFWGWSFEELPHTRMFQTKKWQHVAWKKYFVSVVFLFRNLLAIHISCKSCVSLPTNLWNVPEVSTASAPFFVRRFWHVIPLLNPKTSRATHLWGIGRFGSCEGHCCSQLIHSRSTFWLLTN